MMGSFGSRRPAYLPTGRTLDEFYTIAIHCKILYDFYNDLSKLSYVKEAFYENFI